MPAKGSVLAILAAYWWENGLFIETVRVLGVVRMRVLVMAILRTVENISD
jgi:hypothetical protein